MTEEASHIPKSIGIILDGNRRWARERGLPTLEGHRRGYNNLKLFTEWARNAGVSYVTAYVFSTENWNRSTEEIDYLMDLSRTLLRKDRAWTNKEGVRIRVVGSHDRLAPDIVESIAEIEKETANNTRITLALALNYGGRLEIVEAAQRLAREGKDITESSLSESLWSHDIPDPDLIIRSSGEQRLSGFMTWKSVYSEFIFTPKNFPAIEESDFKEMLSEYAGRKRRFGA